MRAALLAVAITVMGSALTGPTAAGASTVCVPVENKTVVAVVVQQANASPELTCVVADAEDSGLAILFERAEQFGRAQPRVHASGLVCAIDSLPATGCGQPSAGVSNYWSYWLDDGGSWLYAPVGPATHLNVDDDGDGVEVIGLRFIAGTPSQSGSEPAPTMTPANITFAPLGGFDGTHSGSQSQPDPQQAPQAGSSQPSETGQPGGSSGQADDDAMAYFLELMAGADANEQGEQPAAVQGSTTLVAPTNSAAVATTPSSEPQSKSPSTSLGSDDDTVVFEQAAATDADDKISSPAPLAALVLLAAAVGGVIAAVRIRRRS